ncbi:Alpha/Beta hydrolase protein, partial [Haematococcus lacustris]
FVAGGGEDSVQQPQWSPDGQRLLFISDRSGWWNLYAWGGHDQVESLCALEADFGWPQWLFGLRSYQQLDSQHILAAYNHPKEAGVSLGLINQVSHTVTPIHTGVTHFGSPTVVSVVSSPSTFPRVALMRLEGLQALAAAGPGDWHSLRSSADMALDGGYLSVPQVMEFPSAGGRTAHMVYYPPANKDWVLPEGVLPPLVVHSHGGPTSAAVVSLSLHTQYWTSRGWALADVDYGGSTGYGREYRNRLRGTWGEVDVDDCCAAASWLAAEGKVDPGRMCISGGSAGGFTTLACLAFRDVFSAGCSLYGVADLALLAQDTHKFESRYLDLLVGPLPEAQALYAARSPLLHAQGFTRPIIFFQGEEDAVVPPEQARRMFEAVMQRRLPTALVLFKGEQHGFRQAAAIRAALDGELYFYSKVLGFPGSMPEGVEVPHIHNLTAGHNTT